jgi:uncharacterized protein YprB with RNaseH-like and TPR domain
MNFGRMKKDEIVWMAVHSCKAHGVKYINHPACYVREEPDKQKTGFIDIESTQLRADWGIVLCVSILDLNSTHNFVRTITKKEVHSKDLDKNVVRDAVVEMRKYDRLIGYYASNMRFDIPFLRTRAVHHDLDFPAFGEIIMEDVFPVIKYKFKLSRNRLDNACEALLGKSEKTHWLWDHWLKAVQGDAASLKYIEEHCKIDTKVLKQLYLKIYKFSKRNSASL